LALVDEDVQDAGRGSAAGGGSMTGGVQSELGVDGRSRAVLLVGEEVSVDIQRRLGGRVAEAGLHHLDRRAGTDEHAGVVMAKIVWRGPGGGSCPALPRPPGRREGMLLDQEASLVG